MVMMDKSLVALNTSDLSTPALVDIEKIEYAYIFCNFILFQAGSGIYKTHPSLDNIHKIITIFASHHKALIFVMHASDDGFDYEEDPFFIVDRDRKYVLNPFSLEYEEKHADTKYIIKSLKVSLSEDPTVCYMICRERQDRLVH
jgi:hypothetical protein